MSKVANCRIYKDLDSCSECIQGYYIQNNQCVPVNLAENCLNYNGITGACQECSNKYYLDENNSNTCTARIKSLEIKHCLQTNPRQDTCQQCSDNFELTQNDIVCVPKIENCLSYIVLVVDPQGDHQYKCSKCGDTYYLNVSLNGGKGECIKGSIQNCRKYLTEKDECSECDFSYYLSSPTECLQSNLDHLPDNCSKTDSSKPDTCTQCKTNHILINRSTQCQLAKPFINFTNTTESHCTTWETSTKCLSCEPMYYGTQCQNQVG
jgi:hypothetical protein